MALSKPRQRSANLQDWWRNNQRKLTPYLFIAPTVSIFALWVLIPILYAAYMSFFEWNGIS
ncbi:MAG: hypothetical protein AAF267_17105 [Deinococcota bacterium]